MATLNRERLKRQIFLAKEAPGDLADTLIAINQNTGAGLGTLASLTTTNKTDAVSAINEVVTNVASLVTSEATKAKVKVVAGTTAAGTVDLVDTPTVIIAILAIVTATGAPATKTLLAVTTDYTLATHILTCVTDQSANSLVVIYK